MTTTITATPQPTTASVLLEVEASLAPVTIVDWDATELGAASWTYDEGTATVAFPGLTLGLTYRFTLYAYRTAEYYVCYVGNGAGVWTPLLIPPGSGVWAHAVDVPAAGTSMYLRVPTGTSLAMNRLTVETIPDDYSFTLTRSDANGIRPVRLYAGQDLESGALIVTDYEAALTGPITYSVTTTETATTTTALNLSTPWLMVPVLPQYSIAFERATGFTEDNAARSTVHEIIGAEYPAVTLRPLGRRTGTLEVWCADYTALRATRAVYRRGEVVLLRQAEHPGMDLYHVATGRLSAGLYDAALDRWRLTVEYTEVTPPIAPLSGALGWDLAASLDRNPTLAASAAEFPTLADLLIGPSS